ncbi:Metallo-hydrolase/oxidoreductase [Jaminaea rosea]|uniref:Metallo-hydrolase/oxidoreductase n=1 Tax=Jaminaea rosea TaxID=1569628 RepID=A0A316UXI6_9BASI|nr:Metallo-hydrolase/oxidoreductase [Jaminaea rosea]PWN29704.1 Metallo-hydrolase/oxidoreductase [Jaminaea rosea]
MVFLKNHLRAVQDEYQAAYGSGNGDDQGHSPNRPSLSSSHRPLAANNAANQGGTRLVSAYDVTLLVRSRDPVADAHDPDLERHDIPSHHVPSLVSVATKRMRQRSRTTEGRKRDRAKAKAIRAAEAVKSSSGLPPPLRRAAGSKRFAQPAASQRDFSSSALPLLSFQNPWDSFKPPTLLNVWSGLKWGLPEEYEEGGHSKYRGSGRRAKEAVAEYRAAEAELGKDWADVHVQTPNWGWVESERQTWLEGPNVEREKKEELEGIANGQPAAEENFGKRKEWQDPRAEEAMDHARVTWLGHASTLLQLPPLADPVTTASSSVENIPGDQAGGIDDSLDEDQARQLIRGVSNLDVNAQAKAGEKTPQKRSIVIKADSPGKAAIRREKSRTQQQGERSQPQHQERLAPPPTSDAPTNSSAGGGSATGSARPTPTTEDAFPVIDNVRDRSVNLLFDPIFSKRCSPSQNMGPARFTEIPCSVEDLPPIDIILLSHDHYDHSDAESLRKIRKIRGDAVHVFVGLGNREWLCSAAGFKKSQVSELDWWDEAVLTASGTSPAKQGDPARSALRIICTPAQHGSGRVPGGKDSTLWCSWVVEQISPQEPSGIQPPSEVKAKGSIQASSSSPPGPPTPSPSPSTRKRWRAFFAGDTGLRRHGEKATNRRSPVCPAFEEIARKFGTPHLFLLPISIGSSLSYLRSKDPFPRRYSPFPRVSEALTSCIHMDAEDAVQMMEIMTGYAAKGKEDGGRDDGLGKSGGPLALAVHFGTFVRNAEQTKADVRNLRAACRRHGVGFGRTREGRFEMASKGGGDNGQSSGGTSAGQRGGGTSGGRTMSTLTTTAGTATGSGSADTAVHTNGSADPAAGGASERKGTKTDMGKGKFLVADQGETVWIKMATDLAEGAAKSKEKEETS